MADASASNIKRNNALEDLKNIKGGGVYALLCPDSGDVVYVGRTSSLRSRIHNHLKGTSGIKRVTAWVLPLLAEGKTPGFKVLCYTNDETEQRRMEGYFFDLYTNTIINKAVPGGQYRRLLVKA